VQTGKFLRTLSGERNQILALDTSPNGKIIATGSVGTEINLMVYPLKVLLAKPKPRQAGEADDTETPQEGGDVDIQPGPDLPTIDQSALADASSEEAVALAYKVVSSDDPQASLRKLQGELNAAMKAGHYCDGAKALDGLAHQILVLAPYDKAAFHALLVTSIIQQDLKMIYLATKIGQRTLFFPDIYNYDLPQAVDARFDFWQKEVFDPTRRRAGRKLELEFVGCDGQSTVRTMPLTLLQVDIPVEVMRVLAQRRVRLNFQQFRALDDQQFLSRLFLMIEHAMEVARRGRGEDKPEMLELKEAPMQAAGVLSADLSDVDVFGYPGAVPFELRRSKGPWVSYYSDRDRKKQILLPTGNYYLRVADKIRAAFVINAASETPIKVKMDR
jgi:hypothetical protein